MFDRGALQDSTGVRTAYDLFQQQSKGRDPMDTLNPDDLPVGVLRIDARGLVADANRTAVDVLARPLDEMRGEALATLVADESAASLDDLVSARGCSGSTSAVVRLAGEPARWAELAVGGGDAEMLTLAIREVTDEVRTFRVLREAVQVAVVSDDEGMRTWGPVGRIHPEDRLGNSGGSLADRLHPEDAAPVFELWKDVVESPGARARFTVRARLPPSTDGWGLATFELANLRHVPQVGGILLTMFDHQVEERVPSLAHTRGAYLSVADAAPVGIILLGPRGFPMYFNQAAKRLVDGIGIDEEGGDRDWPGRVIADQRDEVRRWLAATIAAEHEDTRLARFDGPQPRWLLVTVAPRSTDEDNVVGFVVTLQDVTGEVEMRHELEEAHAQALHLATHDTLTGVANRHLLTDALIARQASAAAPDVQRRSIGVVFCDLDGFKQINDEHGHQAGDQMLIAVADRLCSACRTDDLVARIGGDEFVVLVDDATEELLDALRARIADACAEPIEVAGDSIVISLSTGTAILAEGEGVDDLMRRADEAMYAHKARRGHAESDDS